LKADVLDCGTKYLLREVVRRDIATNSYGVSSSGNNFINGSLSLAFIQTK
jgi:hypothetical protein